MYLPYNFCMQFKYLCIQSGKSQNGTISDKTKKASFLFWHVLLESSFSGSSAFITIDFTISIGINHVEMFLIHGVSIEHPVLESQAIFAVHFFPIQSHASVGITNTSNNADSSFNVSFKVKKNLSNTVLPTLNLITKSQFSQN